MVIQIFKLELFFTNFKLKSLLFHSHLVVSTCTYNIHQTQSRLVSCNSYESPKIGFEVSSTYKLRLQYYSRLTVCASPVSFLHFSFGLYISVIACIFLESEEKFKSNVFLISRCWENALNCCNLSKMREKVVLKFVVGQQYCTQHKHVRYISLCTKIDVLLHG